jgi:class 3 adenylate cyclase
LAWETLRVEKPDTSYARSGNVFVAYQAFGEGPFDLVIVPGGLSNIEYGWEFECWQNYYRTLATFARVLLFDKRGTGISDPVLAAPSLEERMDDVRAVMDAAGSERAALLGSLDGAAIAALFAATHPERTAALILNNPLVRGRWAPDYPWGSRDDPESAGSVATTFVTRDGVEELIAENMPGRADDEKFARQMTSYLRLCASPSTVAKLSELTFEIDVREALSTIRAPTLVTHVGQPQPEVDERADTEHLFSRSVHASRYVAERIPGARFVESRPGDPVLWAVDQSESLALLREFSSGAWEAGAWERSEPDRVLATLLFTDLVGSTERVADLGDARWRDLIQQHHAFVRRQLVRFRGREIDTAGDGFFASFDGPARGLRCAYAVIEGVSELGLEARAGVHTGECEIIDGKPGGLAVVVGARISSIAPSGVVLASSTVKDLVVGSGITFEDRGEHELKGVPGAWKLHAVVDAQARN